MKKLLFGTILLALVLVSPIQAMARVDVGISISLPPLIVFSAPPEVIVIPGTYVYAVPDLDVDIFFYNGWWWRLWEGRWYRSRYYNRGWGYYHKVPNFYFDIDPGWRGYYRDRNWYGQRWDYERIPSQRLQQNWKSWKNARYWERQRTWGVQNYQPRQHQQRQELRQQRQQQYQQRPEVQKHQQQSQPQVQKPQVQQPRQQAKEKVQQPQKKPRAQQPRQQSEEKDQQPHQSPSQKKPERGEKEKHDRR